MHSEIHLLKKQVTPLTNKNLKIKEFRIHEQNNAHKEKVGNSFKYKKKYSDYFKCH